MTRRSSGRWPWLWTDALLEVRNLQVDFATSRGLVHAVDGVDLDVRHGEVLALVGESGCGKTTLIRSILGLERMSAGTRRVRRCPGLAACVVVASAPAAGADDLPGSVRRVEPASHDLRSGRRGDPHPQGRRRRADARGRGAARGPACAHRQRYMPRYPHEVSGGQRQRVLIAGAMALGPQLLLADEPVASLDASIRGEILALMRSLVDEHGISIIAVTHDLGLAWNIADRVAVMYLGRIVEVGDDRAGAVRSAAPVHASVAVGRSREGAGGAADPHR